jgi:hypothetical protein
MGLPTASIRDIMFVGPSFVSYGSCAVSASHGRTHCAKAAEKEPQLKASVPPRGPQRALQPSYVIPQAKPGSFVYFPSLPTRNDELGEALYKAAASRAHWVKLKEELPQVLPKGMLRSLSEKRELAVNPMMMQTNGREQESIRNKTSNNLQLYMILVVS